MSSNVNVTVGNEVKMYESGTTLLEISKDFQKNYEYDIILAYKNDKLCELFKTVTEDCSVQFFTTKDDVGHKTYGRGMTLVMLKAFYDELGYENIEKIQVEYALGAGSYCNIETKVTLGNEEIERIKMRMKNIVESDIAFEKITISTDEAMKLFKAHKMYDKVRLFRYRRVSKANIYRLLKFEDYFYGYMPPSTGILKYFDLFLYENGFILMMPPKETPNQIKDFLPSPKLFQTLEESDAWSHTMEVGTVGALNDVIAQGGINDLILVQEAFQEKKIGEIAEQIKNASDKKFIMIAGPSSSGKTTFSHRLSIQLRTYGLKPHPIAVDDYFLDRENTPKDENGEYNFETLDAIDIKQFNEDMTALLRGETVELPSFNFKQGRREYKGNYKTLGEHDILVIEGIHCLNDRLSRSLPKESKFKIYISALTQLNIDEHNRIPTTDGRLIRRMVRDARTRGTTAQETLSMWPSVRRGEEQNIFPYQEEADVMFNSALIYELAVLKQYAEPLLFGIDKNAKEYIEAKRILKFMDYFIGVTSEEVPKNSILKEFIGGSCFKV